MNTQKLTQKSLEAIQSANGLAIELRRTSAIMLISVPI